VNQSVQLTSMRLEKRSFSSVKANGPFPAWFARNQVKKSCSRRPQRRDEPRANAAVTNMNRTSSFFKGLPPADDVQLTITNECRYSHELPVACHIVRLRDVIKMKSDKLYVSTNAAPSS
jgi:hypothetical protein